MNFWILLITTTHIKACIKDNHQYDIFVFKRPHPIIFILVTNLNINVTNNDFAPS